MFRPLSLFVGLRYVRARTNKFFVSFITWVSLLGVCLGVAALIVVLSVMNGFEGELRGRLLALSAHARIIVADAPGVVPDWAQALALARAQPAVLGAAPYVEVQALALRTPEMLPVQLRGIDPVLESGVTGLAGALLEGSLNELQPGSNHIVLGSVVARLLMAEPGDRVTLLVPTSGADGLPQPKLREFTVTGIFEVGLQDHDAVLALASLADVRAMTAADPRAEGIRLKLRDVLEAPQVAAALARRLPPGFTIRNWTEDHASYFRAIRIEKTMMSLILMLIVGIAAFNIVAMLVMVVTEKRNDIAILRTQGASRGQVMGAFATQGLVIGWLGVGLGIALGVTLAANVGSIVPWLEGTFRFQVFSPDVFYIVAVPSELRWANVAWIGAVALALTGLATIYPALRAARVAPAEALRYE